MKSILQDEKRCYLCGAVVGLERHHIMAGLANRSLSERHGLWVWLCHNCHTGPSGVQYDREKNFQLKADAQEAFEKVYGRSEWMKLFRKSYIW